MANNDFAKHRESPKRGVAGMRIGRNHDIITGIAAENIGFGDLVFQDSGDIEGRFRPPKVGYTVDMLEGAAEFTHKQRPVDENVKPGYTTDQAFSTIRKEKIWLAADTDLTKGTLFVQLLEESGREVGVLYQTASTTPANSLDISSVATVFKPEIGDDVALIELSIR